MAARITKSLDKLRSQVNELAPKRSKASDGWLGDAKHSMRKSDHNPEPDGTVDALDITHDPKNGVDIQRLCDAIIASKDRRVSYLICNGKIISGNSGPKPWVKRPYSGANKHDKHLHVSVLDAYQDDTAPWGIGVAFKAAPPPRAPAAPKAEAPRPKPEDIYDGKVHEEVRQVQQRLNDLGYPEVGTVDGRWGGKTEATILAFQNDNKLPLKPKIDDELLAALLKAPQRYIAPARANADAGDLREKGSMTIKAADAIKIGSGTIAAGGLVLGGADAVETADPVGDKLGILKTIVEIIDPIKDFIGGNLWWILPAVGVVGFWYAMKIIRIRVDDHRTGKNVGL